MISVTKETFLEKCEAAIEKHLQANSTASETAVKKTDLLIDLLLEEFGLSDSTTYNGWKIERVHGQDKRWKPWRLRGGSRHHYGYFATKEGIDEEACEPMSSGDAMIQMLHMRLDFIDKYSDKYSKQSGDEA